MNPTDQTSFSVPRLDDYVLQVREWLAAHLDRRVGPREAHADIGFYTPEVMATARRLQRSVFEAGYAGITWPRQFGGQGLPKEYEWAFNQEAADYLMPDFGLLAETTFETCVPTMLQHAEPAFLEWFVPQVLRGEALVCQFFSEPSAGSDLAAARTRATNDGDEWVIAGQKTWSSYAQLADWGMCLARTDFDVPKHQGLTWFAVPCNAPGLTVRPIRQITGATEFCEEFFDDVVVPDAYRISDLNDGWAVAQTMLVLERGAGGSRSGAPLGPPGPLAPDLVEVARLARRLNDPVARQKIAQAHTNDFVERALKSRVGELDRLGLLNAGVAAYVKLFAGTYNPVRARLAIEIGGAAAMAWQPDDVDGAAVSQAYLDGRRLSIAGGTNEVQRNAISERALGMPREKSADTKVPFSQALRNAANWGSQ